MFLDIAIIDHFVGMRQFELPDQLGLHQNPKGVVDGGQAHFGEMVVHPGFHCLGGGMIAFAHHVLKDGNTLSRGLDPCGFQPANQRFCRQLVFQEIESF